MANLYVAIPTEYTFGDYSSLSGESTLPNSRPRWIDHSSFSSAQAIGFVGYAYQGTGSVQTYYPLYAVWLTTGAGITTSNITSCWLQDSSSSAHVSSPSNYSDVTNVWEDAVSTPLKIIGNGGTYYASDVYEVSGYLFSGPTTYGTVTNAWSHTIAGYTHYFYITVNQNNLWKSSSMAVTAGYRYTIQVHCKSEANYDGVIVTSASNSSGTISGASSCTGYITHGSGTSFSNEVTYDAVNGGSIYVYFKTDSSTTVDGCYGEVVVSRVGEIPVTTVTVTFEKNGGSGGTSSVNITPNTSASNCPAISVPTRGVYSFVGYWDSSSLSGTKYIDSSGSWVHNFDKSSNTTFYAGYYNTLTYSTNNASVYCSSSASAHTSTQSSQQVTISSSGWSCGNGGTVTYSALTVNSTSSTTWTVSSDGKKLTIPSGVSSGTYTVRFVVNSPAQSSQALFADTKSITITITVIANAISSYANPTVSHTTPVSLNKAGQTYTMSPTFSQTATWNNGASSTITSGGSYTYAVQTSKTGYSLGTGSNSNKVTVTNNTSTSARNGFVVRITCTANGKSGTKDVTFNQPAGSIVYGSLSITSTYEYLYFYASGETQAPKNTISYSLPYTWNGVSGSGGTYTSGATVTYKTTGTLPSGFSVESNFSSTGRCTWASRSTTTGSERYAEDYLYVEVTLNGVTGTKDCSSCYQQANTASTSTSITAYGTPTVSIGTGIVASGGSATVTCSVSNTQRTTTTYTSGSSTSSDSSVAGTARWMITSNGNSAFTASGTSSTLSGVGTVYNSGGTISHSNMTSNARTDTVVVTAYNVGSTSKTATAEDVTTNSLGWEKPVVTLNPATVSMSAAGGTYNAATPATATQQQKYTSGTVAQTINVPSSAFQSTVYKSKTGYSLSSNVVTVTNNTSTAARNGFQVKVYAVYNNRQSESKVLTFNQPAGSQGNLTPVITGYSYSTAGATGVTNSAPTVTYQQEQNAWNGVAGTGTVVSTGGTLAYTTTGTLPSGFSTGTNFATTGNITWANNTSASTKDAKSNLKVTVTLGGLTSSAYTCTACSQSAGAMVYANPSITGFSYADFAAGGATKSPTVTYSQTYTWNGVSGSGGTVTSGGTLAYATTGTLPSGFSVASNYTTSGSTTWASRTTTAGDARDAKSNLTVTVTLNGKSSTAYTCTSCKQVANAVTALALVVGSNTINYNGTTTCTATATYTSGSTLDVSGNSGTTYSTSPTGVVTVTK